MVKNYAESESGEREEDNSQCDGSIRPGGLGSAGRESTFDGDVISNGIVEADSQGIYRNQESFNYPGTPNFGKILSQLRELQASHLAYVEGHEERLRARLKAAQDHHNQVLGQMRSLEQEILNLLGEGDSKAEGAS